MAKDDELLAELRRIGPDLVKIASGLEAITRLVGAMLNDEGLTQTENRGETVFDRQEARALENANRGNFLLPQAPIAGWRAG